MEPWSPGTGWGSPVSLAPQLPWTLAPEPHVGKRKEEAGGGVEGVAWDWEAGRRGGATGSPGTPGFDALSRPLALLLQDGLCQHAMSRGPTREQRKTRATAGFPSDTA